MGLWCTDQVTDGSLVDAYAILMLSVYHFKTSKFKANLVGIFKKFLEMLSLLLS